MIMKAVAQRPRDLLDLEALLDAHPQVDLEQVRSRRWGAIVHPGSAAHHATALRLRNQAMTRPLRRTSPDDASYLTDATMARMTLLRTGGEPMSEIPESQSGTRDTSSPLTGFLNSALIMQAASRSFVPNAWWRDSLLTRGKPILG